MADSPALNKPINDDNSLIGFFCRFAWLEIAGNDMIDHHILVISRVKMKPPNPQNPDQSELFRSRLDSQAK